MAEQLPAPQSLLEREEQQLRLFRSSEIEGVDFSETENRGVFTGERLFAQDRERYRIICSLLAEGMSCRMIARLTRTSINTVMAVRDREPAIIEADKQLIGRKMRGAVRLLVDKVLESIEDGSVQINNARDLQTVLVGTGILTDKSELLMGGATQRVERVQAETVGDLDELWEALPADTVEAECEDVPADTQGTGLPGETSAAKGAADPAGEADPDATSERSTDMQSDAPAS